MNIGNFNPGDDDERKQLEDILRQMGIDPEQFGEIMKEIQSELSNVIDEFEKTGKLPTNLGVGGGKKFTVGATNKSKPQTNKSVKYNYEVHSDKENVYITMEMPHFEENEIALAVEEDGLLVTGEGAKGKMSKTIKLPLPVKAETMEHTYSNGILDVHLKVED